MSTALRDLCELVAEVAVAKADEMARAFRHQLGEKAQVDLTQEQLRTVVMGFAFTNWAVANGIWSNLTNTRLRRDLMATSRNAVVLRVARALHDSDDARDTACLAASIDLDRFRPFAQAYVERARELQSSGIPFDMRVALLFGLEWVQSDLGIADSAMDLAMPALLAEIGDCAEYVESIALETNRAAEARSRRGLLSRFLEGFTRWR